MTHAVLVSATHCYMVVASVFLPDLYVLDSRPLGIILLIFYFPHAAYADIIIALFQLFCSVLFLILLYPDFFCILELPVLAVLYLDPAYLGFLRFRKGLPWGYARLKGHILAIVYMR